MSFNDVILEICKAHEIDAFVRRERGSTSRCPWGPVINTTIFYYWYFPSLGIPDSSSFSRPLIQEVFPLLLNLHSLVGHTSFGGPEIFLLRAKTVGSTAASLGGIVCATLSGTLFGLGSLPFVIGPSKGFAGEKWKHYRPSLAQAMVALEDYANLMFFHLDANFPLQRLNTRKTQFNINALGWQEKSMLVTAWQSTSKALEASLGLHSNSPSYAMSMAKPLCYRKSRHRGKTQSSKASSKARPMPLTTKDRNKCWKKKLKWDLAILYGSYVFVLSLNAMVWTTCDGAYTQTCSIGE